MKYLLILFCLSTSLLAASLENVSEMFAKECSALSTVRPIRIGILTLTPNQDAYRESNAFGELAAEQLENALVSYAEKIRLYERKKLADVAQELALNQSDMINAEQAIELGGVVPVDFIVNGTYTKTGKIVTVSYRVIDVVTGEIVIASGKEITLSKGMEELFVQFVNDTGTAVQNIVVTIDTSKKEPELPPCEKEIWPEVRVALDDLGSQASLENIVALVKGVPLDSLCSKVHNRVLSSFLRYEIFSAAYADLLIQELEQSENPDKVYDIATVQRYLLQETMGDKVQWELWKSIAQKSLYPQTALRKCMIPETFTPETGKVASQRLTEVVDLINKEKLGRPVPFDSKRGAVFLIDIFRLSSVEYRKGKEHMGIKVGLAKEMIENLSLSELKYDLSVREDRFYYFLLRNAIERLLRSEALYEKEFLKLIVTLFEKAPSNPDNAELYVRFIQFLGKESEKERYDAQIRNQFKSFRKIFVLESKGEMERYYSVLKGDYLKELLTGVALEFGLTITGIPTVEEIALLLSGNSSEKDLQRAASLLLLAGDNAYPAQQRLLRILRRIERLELEKPEILRKKIVTSLSSCCVDDSLVFEVLFSEAAKADEVSSVVVEGIARRGGRETLSRLEAKFESAQVKDKVTIIKIMSGMKPFAKQIVTTLNQWYDSETDPTVTDAIEDALDLLE